MTAYINSHQISDIIYNRENIIEAYYNRHKVFSLLKTLTINPTPNDANVVLTASGYTQSGNSITVLEGTSVSYTVSKTGYSTQSDTITVNNTQTLNVTLQEDTPSGTIIFESSTPGTYPVDIPVSSNYEVILVGGGGAGFQQISSSFFSYVSGGGSGACFKGIINLSKGTYNVTVGGTTLAFNGIAGIGGNGTRTEGGAGGTLNISQMTSIISSTISSNGNAGNHRTMSSSSIWVTGGDSLYNGYGRGSDSNKSNATNGYIKITKI